MRPPVDVVIPFRGTATELGGVVTTAGALGAREQDRVIVVDNGTRAAGRSLVEEPAAVEVVSAPGRRSSYFARNAGAARGDAPWIVFLDADVTPSPDLLDAYFDPPPAGDVGVLVGAVDDEPAPPGAPAAQRYAALRRPMAQPDDLDRPTAYAQTANCAVRRTAFEEAGGFEAAIRSGGDADLCFRLRAAGWRLEHRRAARVTHRNRPTVRGLLRQKARHGAGAAWLDARYEGAFPEAGLAGLVKWTAKRGAGALHPDRDRRIEAGLDVLTRWAFELGRRRSNGA